MSMYEFHIDVLICTEVDQSLFRFAAFIYVAVLGALVALPSSFDVFVPNDNSTTSFIAYPTTFDRWASVIPPVEMEFPSDATYSIYNLFAVSIGVYVVQQSVTSLGMAFLDMLLILPNLARALFIFFVVLSCHFLHKLSQLWFL